VLRWFDEVQAAGGYRKYYNGSREGSLQGGGTAGGLGLDREFFESAMVPQIMLKGFLGFAPCGDGFRLNPRLPSDWPELSVDRIRFQNLVLRIRATRDAVEIHKDGPAAEPLFLRLPAGEWSAVFVHDDGAVLGSAVLSKRESDGALRLDWGDALTVRLVKAPHAP
jgi:Glycosyl hydrolase family 65, C-terminal domain